MNEWHSAQVLKRDVNGIVHSVEVIAALILIVAAVNFIVFALPVAGPHTAKSTYTEENFIRDVLYYETTTNAIVATYLSNGNTTALVYAMDATLPRDICFNLFISNETGEWCPVFYKNAGSDTATTSLVLELDDDIYFHDYLSGENVTLHGGIYSLKLQYWKEPRDVDTMLSAMAENGHMGDLDTEIVDSDGDGVPDRYDAFPYNGGEWVDHDQDGIGDNSDDDDDGDGVADAIDQNPLDPEVGAPPKDNGWGGWPEISNEAKAASAAASLSILALLITALTESGRYAAFKGLSPLMVPLFTRMRREEILDNEIRRDIYDTISEDPGISFTEIMERLGLKNGTLLYHLSTLEREEMIRSKRDGIYRRFYPANVKPPKKDVKRLYGVQKDLVEYILKHPGTTQSEAASALGQDRQNIHYHINVLCDGGIVRVVKDGRRRGLYLTDEALQGLSGMVMDE